MNTEESLDVLAAALRATVPDHTAANFSIVYPLVREWFRTPVQDRQSETFQPVIGHRDPHSKGNGWISLCRVFRKLSEGTSVQVWITLHDGHSPPDAPAWESHCWYGKDFPDADAPFTAFESVPEYGRALRTFPWHLQLSWQRHGTPPNVATIVDDMRRASLT